MMRTDDDGVYGDIIGLRCVSALIDVVSGLLGSNKVIISPRLSYKLIN
jgi:hypothetical protein